MGEREYLWVNLADLTELGGIGGIGCSPLMLMILEREGDRKLGVVMRAGRRAALDDNWVVIECRPDRAEAIRGGMEVVASRRGVRVRMKTTARPPGRGWRWVS